MTDIVDPDSLISAAEASGTSAQLINDGLLHKVQEIDGDILVAAQIPLFRCTVSMPVSLPGDKIPEMVYSLIQIYNGRGFGTRYDGDVGTLKLSWDFPVMSWEEHRAIRYPNPDKIVLLGYDFPAYLLYLYQTNGVDLRAVNSALSIKGQVNDTIEYAASDGLTSCIMRTFARVYIGSVPTPSLTALYSDLIDMLETAGYRTFFRTDVGLVIDWSHTDAFTPFMYDGSSLADFELDTAPSESPITFNFDFHETAPRIIFVPVRSGTITSVTISVDEGFDGDSPTVSLGTLSDPEAIVPTEYSSLVTPADYTSDPDYTLVTSQAVYAYFDTQNSTVGSGSIILEYTPDP